MNIHIGSDHAGFELKEAVKRYCDSHSILYTDYGTDSTAAVDFPEYAFAVAQAVVKERQNAKHNEDSLGILCCGSGVGMDIAANKVKGARAALALTPYMGRQSREHDDANILILAGRVISSELAIEILEAFLAARFIGDEKYKRRLNMITSYEENHLTL